MAFKEFREKVKRFVEDHFEEILIFGTFATGAVFGGIIAYDAGRAKEHEMIYRRTMNEANNNSGNSFDPSTYIVAENSNDVDDESEDIWDNQDYENWNAVCKLASRMALKPGESYYIQEGGSSHSDCGILVNDTFVAHYDGNGYETYPPDADSYMEMHLDDEDDEHDDGEEDGEYLKIRIPKTAGDDVRQLALDFIDAIESENLKITTF